MLQFLVVMAPQTQTPNASKTAGPAMDVVAPAPPAAGTQSAQKAAAQQSKAASPKATKKGANVGLAIAATVIIVLGLGLMTVYAYLQQTNSL